MSFQWRIEVLSEKGPGCDEKKHKAAKNTASLQDENLLVDAQTVGFAVGRKPTVKLCGEKAGRRLQSYIFLDES